MSRRRFNVCIVFVLASFTSVFSMRGGRRAQTSEMNISSWREYLGGDASKARTAESFSQENFADTHVQRQGLKKPTRTSIAKENGFSQGVAASSGQHQPASLFMRARNSMRIGNREVVKKALTGVGDVYIPEDIMRQCERGQLSFEDALRLMQKRDCVELLQTIKRLVAKQSKVAFARLGTRAVDAVAQGIKFGVADYLNRRLNIEAVLLSGEYNGIVPIDITESMLQKIVPFVLSFDLKKIASSIFADAAFMCPFADIVTFLARYATRVATGDRCTLDVLKNKTCARALLKGLGVETIPEKYVLKLVDLLMRRIGGLDLCK